MQEGDNGRVSLRSCESCHRAPCNAEVGLPPTIPKELTDDSATSWEAAAAALQRPGKRQQSRGKLAVSISFGAPGWDLRHGTCKPVTPVKEDSSDIVAEQILAASSSDIVAEQSFAASLLGVFQVMCYPMGLVGITFVANLPASKILTFWVSSLLKSTLGTGAVAAGWAWLMQVKSFTIISSRTIYRASCYFNLLLGCLWIAANACGALERLNYAEQHEPLAVPVPRIGA